MATMMEKVFMLNNEKVIVPFLYSHYK